jgi:hypothetical protein
MKYYILKQFIAGSQIWVSKLNEEDTVDEFDTLEEAENKKVELESSDPSGRVYRIVEI